MRFLNNVLWVALVALLGLFVLPEVALSATPTLVTSGAHSAPIFHWGWLAAGLLGPLVFGEIADIETLERKLSEVSKELKAAIASGSSELKTKIEALQKQADALDVKLAERHAAAVEGKTLRNFLEESEPIARLLRWEAKAAVFTIPTNLLERKTTITSTAVGVATSGVLQIERTPGIVAEARSTLMVRSVLSARPTTLQVVDFIKVNAPLVIGSPQIESNTKRENAVTFTTVSERVRTLATWIPATRQVLDDMTELESFLRTGLAYYVDLAEEQQLLSGSGSGQDLNGLLTQATAFNTALLPAGPGWTRIDIIGRVIQQITTANELMPTFIVLNPVDWWAIRLTKDTHGRYILGDPMGPANLENLFGLTPVITTSIASGTFLVGSGSPIAAEIRDRMEMTVEIATQHEDYFARNMIAIRAEKRLALVVYRPGSFVDGTFTTSP